MYTHLAPNLTSWISNVWILWFEKSNRYTVVDSTNYAILNRLIASNDITDFIAFLQTEYNFEETKALQVFKDLEQFLIDSNQESKTAPTKVSLELNEGTKQLSKYYTFYGKTIQLKFNSEKVYNLIHPSLAHLESAKLNDVNTCFHLNYDDNILSIFKNRVFIGSFLKEHYNKFHGKFIMELICSIYSSEENDWLGLFHASTVSNDKEAIMCLGHSGNGKSTLSALLMASGLKLISDDLTPLKASDNHVYSYPGSISVKQGAFEVLSPLVTNFDALPSQFINNAKGVVKYIPPHSITCAQHHPCTKIVLVHYKSGSFTQLKKLHLQDALHLLISDSWISPEPNNVKKIMSWLSSLTFYQLTYSNSKEAIAEFVDLFD